MTWTNYAKTWSLIGLQKIAIFVEEWAGNKNSSSFVGNSWLQSEKQIRWGLWLKKMIWGKDYFECNFGVKCFDNWAQGKRPFAQNSTSALRPETKGNREEAALSLCFLLWFVHLTPFSTSGCNLSFSMISFRYGRERFRRALRSLSLSWTRFFFSSFL